MSSQQWWGQNSQEVATPCSKGSMKGAKPDVKGSGSGSSSAAMFRVIVDLQSRVLSLESEASELKDEIRELKEAMESVKMH